jgi:integrase
MEGYRDTILRSYRILRDADLLTDPKKMERRELDEILKGYQMRKNYVLRLGIFLNYLGNPVLRNMHLRFQKTRYRARWLTPQQADMYIRSAKTAEERLVAHEELELGFRRIEVMRIRVIDEKTNHMEVLGKGKYGGKWRNVQKHPLSDTVLDEWRDHRSELIFNHTRIAKKRRIKNPKNPQHLLIYGKNGHISGYSPNSENSINRIIRNIGDRCGLVVSNHDLRRTFGRGLWEALGRRDLETVAEQMGIYDINVCKEYLGIKEDEKAEAMKKLHEYQQKIRIDARYS